jgi:hypothetical protein
MRITAIAFLFVSGRAEAEAQAHKAASQVDRRQ